MAAMDSHGPRFRPRPAHPPGPTFLTYTPNGTRLVTAGSNNIIRMFITGSDDEPENVLDVQEQNAAVVAADDFFVAGSEDGTVWKYSVAEKAMDKMLVRCGLPIRDLALSPDTKWVAVSSDELTVKIVNVDDIEQILFLREQPKPIKHVTFDPTGKYIAASCTDGIIYVYEMGEGGPTLFRRIDGVIGQLETDAEATSRAVWHSDGRLFAVATTTRDILTVSIGDGEKQRSFSGGHMGNITALAWSPNGAMLATAASDDKILLWETRTQKIIARYDYRNVTNLAWHPTSNIFCCSTSNGEIFIQPDFILQENLALLKTEPQPSPFIHDPLTEPTGYGRRALNYGQFERAVPNGRQHTPDSIDEMLDAGDEDDFIDDDDGAGYVEGMNGYGKRTNGHLDDVNGHDSKRRSKYQTWQPRIHSSFQPGSTPWRGNRKYLCLNLIGFIWTVDQDTHNTVTIEFYDREFHRDTHFTDPYLYDKASLNENGALFSCSSTKDHPAMVFYRPHETWTSRADWRTELPEDEEITSMSLSDSFIVVTTSKGYVRIYTLFGTPFRIYRQKSSPIVTCASWRDYILTLGNGPVGGDGCTKLLYTIENVKQEEVCQNEDVVALGEDAVLKNVFFSDQGDPCIYDSTGVLLTLLHWRTPGQAKWVPLLDTTMLERLAGGKKEETYWPVAVAQDKFHCIILKGGDQYPYFPRPLLSEFDFKIPLSTTKGRAGEEEDDDAEGNRNEGQRLEESFVRNSVMLSLLEDMVSATTAAHAHRTEVARKEIEADKILLQLLAAECREGEERGMRALELVGLMRDRGGKMIDAAGKVAGRFGRTVLEEKIRELAERRLMGVAEHEIQ